MRFFVGMKTSYTVSFSARMFFQLVRWRNLLMIVLTQLMVRYWLVGADSIAEVITDKNLWLIVGATVLVAAGGYIINDYFDVKIDLINKPDQVVIGRYIRRRLGMTWHQLLTAGGILSGLAVNKWVFFITILAAALLWFYAAYFKKKPFIGNLTVALLTAFSLIIMLFHYRQNQNLIIIYSIFVFMISLVREIIKDMEDVRGDESHGCETLPIVWGIRRTKNIVYILIAIFILILYLSAHNLNNIPLSWIFTAIVGLLGWLTYRLVYADTKREFGRLSQLCKIIMLVGMGSMVVV